jgi:predicted Rossmann fold nucleotide-binding protein DprA/Smf involved in DNA uptake
MNRPSSIEYLGNQDLLNCRKWGFIASRTVPSDEVLRCYDWASERAAAGDCVVSGFNSRMEQDVLHFLLRGKGKVIIVLARRMYKVIPEEWQQPLSEGRMLIISTTWATRQSRQTALARNRYVEELSDTMYIISKNKQIKT